MTTVINKKALNPNHVYTKVKLKGTREVAEVYDHALPENIFRELQNNFFNKPFPWYLESKDRSKGNYYESPLNNYEITDHTQFNHLFYHVNQRNAWSEFTPWINPVLNILHPRAWFRVKANYVARGHKPGISRGWHYDSSGTMNMEKGNLPHPDFKIAVLYLNTNNGYTIMETDNKVDSIENRLVIFPNKVLHTAILQTDTPHRMLINMVFLPYKK
jgi:hypothetical protein